MNSYLGKSMNPQFHILVYIYCLYLVLVVLIMFAVLIKVAEAISRLEKICIFIQYCFCTYLKGI